MNISPEQWQLFLEFQQRQTLALEKLAEAVQQLTPTNIEAPNYQQPLESFGNFDWQSISARVENCDRYGVALVSWRGLVFTRRSPSNRFGEAIWFSRCVGKDENGNNKYERLITFKPMSTMEVEPIPDRVFRLIGQHA